MGAIHRKVKTIRRILRGDYGVIRRVSKLNHHIADISNRVRSLS